MAGESSDRVSRQVYRLFNFGAVGAMSDAQLLDQFVTRSDEAAEAAFEELVIRHGPMVLRVCRGVLRDAHDAEDAFQAVFLILANRASSIRRKWSVASWLFGVAQRVATRARRDAARRHALEERAAERNPEGYYDDRCDPDWEILHEEIDALPERLRAPIVLCYLQGQSYAAAAHQLGLSEMAIRGRLARGRERLCRRLIRRGVTAPAALLAATAASQVEAAISLTLVHSTIRIAQGFVAGNTAGVLARGVLTSMLLTQLKTATVVLCLGLGGGYSVWQTVAAACDGKTARQDQARVPTVQLIRPPLRKIVRSIGQASYTQARRRTPIGAQVTGYIAKTMVDIGDKVKKGDVLATILVPGFLERRVAKQTADRLDHARKVVAVAEAELRAAEAAVVEANAIVKKYDVELERWDTEIKRLDREVKRGVVDPEVLVESTKQRMLRNAACDAAKATVAKREAEVAAKQAGLEMAKTDLLVAEREAEVADTRSDLGPDYSRTGGQQGRTAMTTESDAATRSHAMRAKHVPARPDGAVSRGDADLKRLNDLVRQSTAQKEEGRSKDHPAALEKARAAIKKAEEGLSHSWGSRLQANAIPPASAGSEPTNAQPRNRTCGNADLSKTRLFNSAAAAPQVAGFANSLCCPAMLNIDLTLSQHSCKVWGVGCRCLGLTPMMFSLPGP